jgi:hypothetical protein
VSGTAGALTLQNGPQKAKFVDYTALWRGGVPVPYPAVPGFVPILVGDENRAVFDASTVSLEAVPPVLEFVGIPGTAAVPGEQLSGLFYDLHAMFAVPVPLPGAPVTAYYGTGPGGVPRNPIPGPVAAAAYAAGAGGRLEIYRDFGTTPTMTNFAPVVGGLGPSLWVPGGAGVPDTFPSINFGSANESLWAQLVFIPFPGAGVIEPAGTLVKETLDVQGTAYGEGYAMFVGGNLAGSGQPVPNAMLAKYLAQGGGVPPPAGLTVDFYVKFSIDPLRVGAPPWLAVGDDPALWETVPEPFTMIGLFAGICGVGGYLRRRRMA